MVFFWLTEIGDISERVFLLAELLAVVWMCLSYGYSASLWLLSSLTRQYQSYLMRSFMRGMWSLVLFQKNTTDLVLGNQGNYISFLTVFFLTSLSNCLRVLNLKQNRCCFMKAVSQTEVQQMMWSWCRQKQGILTLQRHWSLTMQSDSSYDCINVTIPFPLLQSSHTACQLSQSWGQCFDGPFEGLLLAIKVVNSTIFDIFVIFFMESNPYQKKYKQLSMIGKGNYGKVYKVRLNDGKEGKEVNYYVAKKMFLEGLSQQDIKSAYGEIAILEKLNNQIKKNSVPFLVGYQEFFRIDNQLIIIMEYCQEGDLSTYIKQLKKKNQRLDQKIIGYWFTQILFGLRVLHSKNILHRDLKSANIFLTKNFSLKIGDFGISKVLEHSSAITCIGTPLYLSPQVCNNQPYGYSSDLWALGCILYQMCSLRYPFEASNMIVLAKKIVMDKVDSIPPYYDPQLNDIIMRMFEKEAKQRISAEQIFRTEYFRKVAQNFLADQGRMKELAVPIDMEETIKQEGKATGSEHQDTWKTINSMGSCSGPQNTKTLTTKERLVMKKLEQAKKRQAELNAHSANEFKANQTILQAIKQKNQGMINKTGKYEGEVMVLNTNKAMSEIKATKKQKVSFMEQAQDIPLDIIFNTINNISVKDADDEFEEIPPLPGTSSYVPVPTSNYQKTVKKNAVQVVQPKVEEIEEEIDEELEEYYDEEFQDYVEPTSAQKLEIKREKQDIVSYFQNQLGLATMSPGKKTMVQAALKPLNSFTAEEVTKAKEAECIGLVGDKRFRQLEGMVRNGKIDFRNLLRDKKYTTEDRKVIYKIEEMQELKHR